MRMQSSPNIEDLYPVQLQVCKDGLENEYSFSLENDYYFGLHFKFKDWKPLQLVFVRGISLPPTQLQLCCIAELLLNRKLNSKLKSEIGLKIL